MKSLILTALLGMMINIAFSQIKGRDCQEKKIPPQNLRHLPDSVEGKATFEQPLSLYHPGDTVKSEEIHYIVKTSLNDFILIGNDRNREGMLKDTSWLSNRHSIIDVTPIYNAVREQLTKSEIAQLEDSKTRLNLALFFNAQKKVTEVYFEFAPTSKVWPTFLPKRFFEMEQAIKNIPEVHSQYGDEYREGVCWFTIRFPWKYLILSDPIPGMKSTKNIQNEID